MKTILVVIIILAALEVGWIIISALSSRPKTLQISGSTTCLPVIQTCATSYEEIQTDVDVTVTGGGSSVGVKDCGEGTSDIGMASRTVKPSEKATYPGIQEHPFARDGVAVIVNPNNPVKGLTISQIRDIYEGKITNWKQVGGNDAPVVVMGRDSASGTRETFEVRVGLEGATYEAFQTKIEEYNSNGGLYDAVVANPNAIGYIGIGYIDVHVKAITVNGIACTPANVKSDKYPIARKLYLLTMPFEDPSSDKAKDITAFINFVLGPQGQSIVAQEGFVAL